VRVQPFKVSFPPLPPSHISLISSPPIPRREAAPVKSGGALFISIHYGPAGRSGFQSTPKLSFGDGGRAQMFRKTVPDDRSGNAETSSAGFRCCSLHDQISTFHRTETALVRKIRCIDMQKCWKSGNTQGRHLGYS